MWFQRTKVQLARFEQNWSELVFKHVTLVYLREETVESVPKHGIPHFYIVKEISFYFLLFFFVDFYSTEIQMINSLVA